MLYGHASHHTHVLFVRPFAACAVGQHGFVESIDKDQILTLTASEARRE